MKLLISIQNLDEVALCLKNRVDIIDVKDPSEGSLGGAYPLLIKMVKEIIGEEAELSAAIGDMPNLPNTAALAALGAAISGAEYVKVGLYGVREKEDAIRLLGRVSEVLREFDDSVKLVAAGYADAHRISSLSPHLIPEVAEMANADVAMLDTAVKDGRRLTEILSFESIRSFTEDSHRRGLEVALAGSLKKEDISIIRKAGADIIGFRGAVCEGGRNGKISERRLIEILEAMRK
ncbi:MAG: (5-formylfuran-3-yl)methyl phosphate synthase [Archaeoglobi archaeon]|nr:(5-formylfuran-3-yl)methyl phosphate synthase [Archaeoglobi archaeon]MDK2782049.1 (5-formylfuran-3-yl)methyl phosphate synthase [Archaeoglobi archaeon]